jgi:hypothetical protein
MLSGLPAYNALVVMMEQCYSGAFSSDVLGKSTAAQTVFTAAAPADEVSWGGNPFDAFAGVWIEALAGAHGDGSGLADDPDGTNNGRVSMREAFDYAVAHDTTQDHPVYADSPAGCGQNIWLGQVNLRDMLPRIARFLEEVQVGRIPLPDPPPDHDLLRQPSATLHRQLVGLAKAISPHG